jgi:hypothetical protein
MMRKTVDWLVDRPWRMPVVFLLLAVVPDNSYVWLVAMVLTTALITFVCVRDGFGRALELMIGGLLLVAVVGYLMQRISAEAWFPRIDSRLVMWGPALFTGLVIRRTQSLVLGIQLLLLVALAVVGVLFVLGDPIAFWAGQSDLDTDLLRVLTGILGAAYLLCLIGGILLGRTGERMARDRRESAGGRRITAQDGMPRSEFASLAIGKVLATAWALCFLVGVYDPAVYFANAAWILAAGLAYQGLSVAQAWLQKRNMTGPWLPVMCVAMAVGMPVAVPLMAVLGFVDNWFDLRRRTSRG